MQGDRETPSTGCTRVERSRPYRLLVGALRVAWFACTFAIFAMIVTLVVRSPQFVMVYRAGMLAVWVATAYAGVMFLLLISRFPELSGNDRLRSRASVLVALLLADLLDPE